MKTAAMSGGSRPFEGARLACQRLLRSVMRAKKRLGADRRLGVQRRSSCNCRAQRLPISRQRRRTTAESGHTRLLQGKEADNHRSEGSKYLSTSQYFSCQRDRYSLVSHWIMKNEARKPR